MLKQFCKENYRTAILLVLGSFALSLVFFPPYNGKLNLFLKFGSFTAALWVFLWLGNAHTSGWVSNRISWTEEPIKRFLVGMLVMVVYTVSAVSLLVWLFRMALNFDISGDLKGMLYGSLIVTLVISLFMHSRGFLQNWKQAAIDAERAKQESLRAQYVSLRSQVNPHFLFNSLNALTNLVYEDQGKAASFIKQLSEVYRYVLDTHSRELVPLSEELKFLNSYLYLQKIRFGEKLQVSFTLNDLNTQVPPLAMQMLLENAIKHNIISDESPLVIRVFKEGDAICITNSFQKRMVLSEETSGIGLANIRKRYEFFTSKEVVVEQTDNLFTVRLPMIRPEAS